MVCNTLIRYIISFMMWYFLPCYNPIELKGDMYYSDNLLCVVINQTKWQGKKTPNLLKYSIKS